MSNETNTLPPPFLHNVVDDIDLRNLKGVSDFDAGDIPFVNKVVWQVSAGAQHLLKLSNGYDVRIVRKHHLVEFS